MGIEEECENENFEDEVSVKVEFKREHISSLDDLKNSRKKNKYLKDQLLKYEEQVKRIEEYIVGKFKDK